MLRTSQPRFRPNKPLMGVAPRERCKRPRPTAARDRRGRSSVLRPPGAIAEDHQVLYGRRGIGKTHALHYLRSQVEDAGDVTAYIDLRTIGSAGGVYGDPSLPIAERGTKLLSDVLSQIVDRLQGYVLARSDDLDPT